MNVFFSMDRVGEMMVGIYGVRVGGVWDREVGYCEFRKR